jgi:ubiquinone/menaquinone biosynthesis C-methylase UbiE
MAEKRDFDQVASSWDEEPRRVKLAGNVAAAIIDTVHPDQVMDALDFGCGTGLVTLRLRPWVRSIVGVDSSQGMLSVLERKVRERGMTNVETILCDVEKGERPGGRFHLIVSSMTLHHLPEPKRLFTLFHELLLPGGMLGIADLDAEDGSFHEDPAGVHHHGFDREQIMALLSESGFVDCGAKTADVIVKGAEVVAREYPVFLITARRPA